MEFSDTINIPSGVASLSSTEGLNINLVFAAAQKQANYEHSFRWFTQGSANCHE